MRIILYTGKGGVGKTSIAAATGLELARLGYQTLVMSVDPAHSLSDSFDLDRMLMDREEGRAVKIRANLWMQEVDVQEEIARYWEDVFAYITTLLNASGLEEVVAEELAIFPGMEEICSLLYVNQYAREHRYDVVLLDCAPTGESLRFISIPTALDREHEQKLELLRHLSGDQFNKAFLNDEVQSTWDEIYLADVYAKKGNNADLKNWASTNLPKLKDQLNKAEKLS